MEWRTAAFFFFREANQVIVPAAEVPVIIFSLHGAFESRSVYYYE
jgi:hypothetical protein